MKIAIRYFTRTGNTKKLAEAIGAVAGVPAEMLDVPVEENVDILFLGSSVYAAGVDEKVKEFIDSMDPTRIKKVINFSTAALLPSTYAQVSKRLAARGIPIDSREFHCRGSFMMTHKGHPDAGDIAKVKGFVQEVLMKQA